MAFITPIQLSFPSSPVSVFLAILFIFSLLSTAHAFGAGSIPPSSPVKGTNWLHGDITSILLSVPKSTASRVNFTEHDVRVIYFGSWLRDLSQVIDAGVLKLVPEAVARAVVGVLGYVEFGKATGEFEVTKDRLGAYRHEEHIDNTKGYETEGNAELDSRLRTTIDPKEYDVDHDTGMLNLVANEKDVEFTAAGYMRRTLAKTIKLGREARQKGDEKMMHEAYINLGGVLHVLDDFAAHSNYIELALHIIGEKDIFLYAGDKAVHVGPKGKEVAPLVTGTFGTEDLWHSLLGTVNDKAATQGIEHPQTSLADLEDRLKDARGDIGGTSSSLLDQLSLIPSGIIPGSLREVIQGISKSSEELKEQEDNASQTDGEEEMKRKQKEIVEEIRKLELREERSKYGEHAEHPHPKRHSKHPSARKEGEVKVGVDGGGLADGTPDDEELAFGSDNESNLPSTPPESEASVPLSNLAWSTNDLFDSDVPTWAFIANAPSEFYERVRPILELRDTIASTLSSASLPSLELPGLPNISLPDDFGLGFDLSPLLQRISGAVDSATFSFLSPYMLPVVQRLRETLTVASHEMLDREGNQFDVFRADSESLCPSHSLLSKDHFTNVLQHPAGLVATVMTQMAAKAVVECWDNPDGGPARIKHEDEYSRRFRGESSEGGEESLDESAEACVDYVISALHHPYYVHGRTASGNSMQNEMLRAVKAWWDAQEEARKRELRHVLSKSGVERGLNHRASTETKLRGHWVVNDDAGVVDGLQGWSTRRWKGFRGTKRRGEKEGSVIGDVMSVVDGVRRDPVGSAWRFARMVVTGEVTPSGLYRGGVETAKGVIEEAVWGKSQPEIGRDEL